MQIFLVGGAVRDKLLDYPVKEKDWVVVGATPEQMQQLGYTPVGKDFPVFLHPDTKEEYALARTERKSGRGYTGFKFYTSPEVTLEDDLIRRDLTINAMAETEDGELVDPYGGRADLQHRLLRHVSSAFAEDPVRVLRIARFAARYAHFGFSIAPTTLILMREMVTSGEVDHLVPERSWKEMSRALMEPSPWVFFQVLRHCGALAKILPELDALFGIPQPPEHHPEVDTGVHALLCLKEATRAKGSLEVRFASLLHDLGKARTPRENWPKHHGHEKRGVAPLKALCSRLAVPNQCRDLAALVSEYHTHSHRALELKPATLDKLFRQTDALRRPERFDDFLLACACDARGRTGLEDIDYPQMAYLRAAFNRYQSITAARVLQQQPDLEGPAIGQKLQQLRIEALQAFKEEYTQ